MIIYATHGFLNHDQLVVLCFPRTVMHAKKACSSSAHSVYLALRLRSRVFTFRFCAPLLVPIG